MTVLAVHRTSFRYIKKTERSYVGGVNMTYKVVLKPIKVTNIPMDSDVCREAYACASEQYNASCGGSRPHIDEIIPNTDSVEIAFTTEKLLKDPVRALKDFLRILVDIEPFSGMKIGNSRRVFTQKMKSQNAENNRNCLSGDMDNYALLSDVARLLFDEKYLSEREEIRAALISLLKEKSH